MRSVWLLLLAGPVLAGDSVAKPAPVIALEDQFQRPHQLGAARGDVVVVIYGDRHSSKQNQQLGAALHVEFHPAAKGASPAKAAQAPVRPIPDWPAGVREPDVRVVAVACAGKVPNLVASMIRSQLRSKSPDVPVLLDFRDAMKQSYGLASGVPNVVILDVQGRVRYQGHGVIRPEQMGQLSRFIEALRVEAMN